MCCFWNIALNITLFSINNIQKWKGEIKISKCLWKHRIWDLQSLIPARVFDFPIFEKAEFIKHFSLSHSRSCYFHVIEEWQSIIKITLFRWSIWATKHTKALISNLIINDKFHSIRVIYARYRMHLTRSVSSQAFSWNHTRCE